MLTAVVVKGIPLNLFFDVFSVLNFVNNFREPIALSSCTHDLFSRSPIFSITSNDGNGQLWASVIITEHKYLFYMHPRKYSLPMGTEYTFAESRGAIYIKI